MCKLKIFLIQFAILQSVVASDWSVISRISPEIITEEDTVHLECTANDE